MKLIAKRANLIHDGRHATRLYRNGATVAEAMLALGRSRQTLWRACKAFADACPAEYIEIMTSPVRPSVATVQPAGVAPSAAPDPLLDGYEDCDPVTRVTDYDLDSLMA